MATTVSPKTAATQAETGAPALAPELRIVEWQNEWIVRGSYPFRYQAPDEMLGELRERYHLDDVIAPGRTEFAQMCLLREWVRTRWDHGWSRNPPPRNALEILRAAEQGSDFNCGYYSLVMMQCLLALGFVARQVGISKASAEWMAHDEGNIGHSICEAWSHQYHKWVLLDADLNIHYERNGLPLSMLEIHRAWVTRRWDAVRVVEGPTSFKITTKPESGFCVGRDLDDHHEAIWVFTRYRVGDYYAHIGFTMRNTQHSSTEPLPTLQWTDEWTPPKLISANRLNDAIWTANEHDLYWTVDQVQINLRADKDAWEKGQAVLHVSLDHSMPNLAKLLVRLDSEPWRETQPEFTWHLHPGKNQIMAKCVNAFGREGHTSRILLRYHP